MPSRDPHICVLGDVHGHLQLGLCMAARWQAELGLAFEAALLCGDVGTFTQDSQLDNATRRHARSNSCELEFLLQWSASPQPAWLQKIFQPVEHGGLGLRCPVVMVHGNHEGFVDLEPWAAHPIPNHPLPMEGLPAIDTGHHIRYLPSGWKCRTPSGLTVAGVGGIERGQRRSAYHALAYLDEQAILHLSEGERVDVLITHQGPSSLQGEVGSPSLELLVDAEIAKVWFHGHSTPNKAITKAGPTGATTIVPMGDIAFPGKGLIADDPGEDGFAVAEFGEEIRIRRERPLSWREFRQRKWKQAPDGQLICPVLAYSLHADP